MANKSVVIIEDNIDTAAEIASIISEMNEFTVAGTCTDGEQGVEIVKNVNPDFVILGIVLKNADGFEVMERIKSAGIKSSVIVISSFTSESVISKALSYGAIYYIAKPFKPETLKSRMKEIAEIPDSVQITDGENDARDYREARRRKSLDEKISKIFISVGIPPHIKGYGYLREGVKMAVESPGIINNITKQLYPRIGEKYDTSASKVERAIRHAIEVAWNRGRIESINSMLGIRAYIGNDKPTNGEFIALIADKMLLEGA